MLQTEIVVDEEAKCQTSEFNNICIREYVAAIRERDPAKCWPFGSICEFKDLNMQDVAPAPQLPDLNTPELPEVVVSKGKELVFEDVTGNHPMWAHVFSIMPRSSMEAVSLPSAFELEIPEGNEAGFENATASLEISKGNGTQLETDTLFGIEWSQWTKGNDISAEIETAMALLEISKGNETQLETAREFEIEIPKEKETRSENATALELELTKEKDTDSEIDTATEIINFNELEGGMGEIVSDGATELVNLSDSANEESVNGGTKFKISVITDDANSGKRTKKRKFRLLSELLRDLAGPTVLFADKVDEISNKSDEDFTIDVDEDDSDEDTLGMFLRKRKAVKVTSRSNGPRNYKKKKARVAKPLKRKRKASKTRTERAKPHSPHDDFATRKLSDALEADMAVVAKRKKCGPYGGTERSMPVAGVGGSKHPDPVPVPDPVVVVDSPGKRWTAVCLSNENPADFSIPGRGNKYMIRY